MGDGMGEADGLIYGGNIEIYHENTEKSVQFILID